jgi:hypothetical protein
LDVAAEVEHGKILSARIVKEPNSILSWIGNASKADSVHRELAEIRDAMKDRFGGEAVRDFPALSGPKLPPLRIAQVAPPDDPEAAANWLINRVNQLDQESRSSWKDLLGRLSGRKAAE